MLWGPVVLEHCTNNGDLNPVETFWTMLKTHLCWSGYILLILNIVY